MGAVQLVRPTKNPKIFGKVSDALRSRPTDILDISIADEGAKTALLHSYLNAKRHEIGYHVFCFVKCDFVSRSKFTSYQIIIFL